MRILAAILLAGLALIAAGCGSNDDQGGETPIACLEGAQVYINALEESREAARLLDETPISECLPPNQSAGDMAQVGEAMIAVATELNAQARAGGFEGAIQLGYLLGAAEKGAEESEGIHSDLIRRLNAAARYAPGTRPLPQDFIEEFEKGFEAGQSGG